MTDSLWRTDQSSLVYAVDDGEQVVQRRDEAGEAPPQEKSATLQPSLVELIAELHANSLSDSPALAERPVNFADSDSVTNHPSSRARTSPGESSYFSFKRWYGALGQPGTGTTNPGEMGQSSNEVTQQFRRAIRRAREADGTASTASSCSSESYDTCVDSPASSTTTWATSASESGADKDAGSSGSTPFPSGDDAEDSPPPLRAAQSVATLRAPRILRKSASSASLTSTSVQVPPRSPYTPPSPIFTTTASPVMDQYAWLSEPPPPSADCQPSTFGSRLASSLRRSASSFTLRLSTRKLDTPPMPSPPCLVANEISIMPSNDTTELSSVAGSTAADRLRDLLLQHDAVVDPSVDPITPLFDPKLARAQGYRSDSDDSSSEGEGEECASEAEAQEALEAEQLLRGVSSSAPPPRSAFDPNSSEEDDDDDPFAANARSEIAWMAPTTPDRSSPDVAPLFFDDEPSSDSPSGAFPAFDPYGFTYARPPMPPLPPIPPPRPSPSRTKVITKKRSFVDPRTRRIRTAPTVTVTPSTPERQRTRY